MSVDQIATFFDVDIRYGLGQQSVLTRIKKFGYNNDPTISADVQKVYKTTVLRGSQRQEIGIRNLVPGDVVLIKEGSRVPVDLRLFKVNNLKIDQSKLTGESLPAPKNTYALKKELPLAQQKCMAFMGSFVSSGSGMGVVVRQAHSSAHTNSLPGVRKQKSRLFDRLAEKRLQSAGVVTKDSKCLRRLSDIETVLINVNLTEQDIQNLILKLQLAKNIDCKFVNQNSRCIVKEAVVFDMSKVKDLKREQLIDQVKPAQFISKATSSDIMKLLVLLSNDDQKVMYVTEGLAKDEALRPAYLSLVIGDFARDDNIAVADMIAPNQKISVLERILYNKK